jgi:outer membrane receptor protein involved in Fe transport
VPWFLLGGYSSSALSQTTPTAASSSPLEEIIVTARKRDESIVAAPESITAFSPQQLQDLRIENYIDYSTKTPNLSFAYGVTDTGINSRSIAIRGISGLNTTAIYIDNTPITQVFDPRVLDIDRIEILRGPQGSLFGADSMGGAIRLISTKPNTSQNSYRAMIQGGSTAGGGSADYGGELGGNFVVVPDVVAVRAVGFYQHDSGFLARTNPSPNDPAVVERTGDQGSQLSYGFAVSALAHVIPDLDVLVRVFNQTNNFPNGWQATLAPLPDFEPKSYNRFQPTNLQDLAFSEVWLPSLEITYQRHDWSLTSATSYFSLHSHQVESSQVGTIQAFEQFFGVQPPPNVPPWYREDHQYQFTQELRLAFDNVLRTSGVFGLYYSNFHWEQLFPPLIYPGLTDLGIGATTDNFFNGDFKFHNQELAAFGELNFHATDKLTLTAGGRQYRLTNDTYVVSDGFINGGLTIGAPPTEKDTGFSPKFGVSYKIGDNANVYATWAKGFRPGGGNQALPPQCDAALASVGLTPETAQTYHGDSVRTTELGAKADLQSRVYLAGALFQTDWDNIQQVINLPACGYQVKANAGAGRIRGGEFETSAKVGTGLDLSFGIGYQDSRITSAGSSAFIVGERLYEVPEWTATSSGTYRWPINSRLGGVISADVSYMGDSLSTNTTPTTPLTRPSYVLANARFGVEWANSSLILYIDNIGNAHANLADLRFLGFNETEVNSAGQTVPLPRVVVTRPIQAGLQYRVHF